MSSSSKFTGLDQIPEKAPIPLLACMTLLPLTPLSVAIGTFLIFRRGAIALTRFLQVEHPLSPVLSSTRRLELMQRDFRWAIEAHRHD